MKQALLLIDVQQGFDDPSWGQRNNPDAEENIARLVEKWRGEGWPVIHVQHASAEDGSSLRPDAPGYAFKLEGTPKSGEPIFVKNVNSAFIGTDLENYLRQNNIEALVIAGLTTDHCVSTTTRMAGNLGFSVQLVADATATFERVDVEDSTISAEEMHRVNLESLNGEFCEVVGTGRVLAEFVP